MNRRTPTLHDSDSGAALLLAISALTLVALLGAVLLANARAEVRQSQRLVDRAEADSILDIAVARAWGDIVDGATTGFTGAGDADGGPWSFRATPVDERRWEILIDAGDGTDSVRGRVIISRDALLPYSLLVEDATTGPLTGIVDGRVGIRGDARFAGRSLGDVQELLGPDASCSGCSNAVRIDFAGDSPAPPGSLPAQPCPDVDGTITGELTGGATYECDTAGPLVLSGSIHVTGPVVLLIGSEVELRFDGADLNVGGDPTELVIAVPTSGGSTIAMTATKLDGILLAPESAMTTTGLRWTGMIVVRDLKTASGSELTGTWTSALESLGFAGWRITGWETDRG